MTSVVGAAVLRGKPLSAKAIERRRQTAIDLDLGQYLQPNPCPGGSRPWTADELALLDAIADNAEVARRIGRSENAVRVKGWVRRVAAKDRP
jgi:hypothetical protein